MYCFTDRLVPVKDRVMALLNEKDRVIIAFDGRSASGKTTAAQWLDSQLDGEVIHMDDFFLPPALRTPERRSAPGGNVHHERFADEVLAGLRSGVPFEYRRFDCSRMDFGELKTAGKKALTIVEGAYSLHPDFGGYYDLAVFFHIEPEEQKKRILARNGADKLNDFTQLWIPLEEKYLAAFDIESRCYMTVGRNEP